MAFFSSFPKKGTFDVSNKSPNISGPAVYNTERGASAFYGHYLGVIKDVFDPSHMGIVKVYIPEICGIDPQDSSRWIPCSYASPFMNTTPPADKNLPQKSSGMWATPVDVNQSVIVIFIRGDVNQAFYVACVPEAYQNRDIAGSAPNIKDEKDPLARTNPDRTNKVVAENSSGGVDQAGNYKRINAGLGVDTGRAPPSGPTMNTPSSCLVLSSPGSKVGPNTKDPAVNPLGYTKINYKDVQFFDGNINNGPGNIPTSTQRTGGHTIRLEDDVSYEHLGLISRSGHQIIMNDTKGCVYINTANGNNWIELTKDGKIDIYCRDSISIRTQADFNFYADRDFNVHAGRYINLVADEHLTTNSRFTSMFSKEDHKIQSMKNIHVKSIEDFTLESKSYSLKAIQDSMLDTLPANLFINCGKARTAQTVRPHKLAPTLGGPESFIRRIPMPEPWPDHETKFDNNWKSDNQKRGATSPTLTDMDPLFAQGTVSPSPAQTTPASSAQTAPPPPPPPPPPPQTASQPPSDPAPDSGGSTSMRAGSTGNDGVFRKTCFMEGTLFKMADGSSKPIENIQIGDEMLLGGKVYLIMQADGLTQDWYEYKGICVTAFHPVLDEGVWKPVCQANSARKTDAKLIVYTLNNENHRMVTFNDIIFTDYAIIDYNNAKTTEEKILILKDRFNFMAEQADDDIILQLISTLEK